MRTTKFLFSRTRTILLAFFVLTACLFSSCGFPSFVPDESNDGNGDDVPVVALPIIPEETLFYHTYTGLVCSEESAAYRPLSICIGNFDGKPQNGLYYADLLIEAPVESGETRLWMVTTARELPSALSSVSSVRGYLLPIVNALGALPVFAGKADKAAGEETYYTGDYIDSNDVAAKDAFFYEEETLYTSPDKLIALAREKGLSLSADAPILPYKLAPLSAPYTPKGNPIDSIKIKYGVGKEALFTYQKASGTYIALRNGAPYGTSEEGEYLSFSNVLVLFHNVSDYHTDTESYFTLDAKAGGSGYCYTGGGVLRITWRYDEGSNLVFLDENGEKLTLNRGRTYISMMKITDAQNIIAK